VFFRPCVSREGLFPLLNWAVRYFPISRILRRHAGDAGLILEIGSGSFGLAHFHRGQVVGCDVDFPDRPEINMLPVRCSGARLPFADSSFEAVVASDVLEHIPPDLRLQVIHEALRVTRKLAVFAFPCGRDAHALDEEFLEFQRRRNVPPPPWLQEHMLYPFPERDLFQGFGDGWRVENFGNEHLRFHDWVNRSEMSSTWSLVFRAVLRFTPHLIEAALRWADRPPYYRMIVVVTRRTPHGLGNNGRT
jgi:predicted SAM-dependent methyltransferase